VRKLRDAGAMLSTRARTWRRLQALEVSSRRSIWHNQYGVMKAVDANRPKELEDENRRLSRGRPNKKAIRSDGLVSFI
jgi:hypothetical protein